MLLCYPQEITMAQKEIVFVIQGDPLSWRHPTQNRSAYNERLLRKSITRESIEEQLPPGFKIYSGPLQLNVRFYMDVPRKKGSCVTVEDYHIANPTLSDFIKHIEESCIGLLFQNDCYIAMVSAVKRYDKQPRTEFTIFELNDKKE